MSISIIWQLCPYRKIGCEVLHHSRTFGFLAEMEVHPSEQQLVGGERLEVVGRSLTSEDIQFREFVNSDWLYVGFLRWVTIKCHEQEVVGGGRKRRLIGTSKTFHASAEAGTLVRKGARWRNWPNSSLSCVFTAGSLFFTIRLMTSLAGNSSDVC